MVLRWGLRMRGKIVVMVLSVVLGVFIAVLGTVAWMNQRESMEEARELSLALSREFAHRITAEFEVALDTARTLAFAFEGLAEAGRADREVLNSILEQSLRRVPFFLGVWSCWEPHALDGKDAEYVNAAGHDATGRFIPYWYRSDGRIALGASSGIRRSRRWRLLSSSHENRQGDPSGALLLRSGRREYAYHQPGGAGGGEGSPGRSGGGGYSS